MVVVDVGDVAEVVAVLPEAGPARGLPEDSMAKAVQEFELGFQDKFLTANYQIIC